MNLDTSRRVDTHFIIFMCYSSINPKMQTLGGILTSKQNYCKFCFISLVMMKKIYSARLADSWSEHKKSLYAANVNVECMNLDADGIIL